MCATNSENASGFLQGLAVLDLCVGTNYEDENKYGNLALS